MTIDHELIAQVQQVASGEIAHRAKTMIACYVGFIGLLEQCPELRDRAIAVETALRTLCATGRLPSPSTATPLAKKR
jgi:hypothetical protein